jgi:hypothetical protein
LVGSLDQAVVIDAARPDEDALSRLVVGLRRQDLVQAEEVIGVPVGHQHALDVERLLRRGPPEPAGQVPGEELVVAAVDEHDLAARRLDGAAVPLLHVDEVHLEHAVLADGHETHSAGSSFDALVGRMNPACAERPAPSRA